MAGGLRHGGRGGADNTQLTSRTALFDDATRGYDSRTHRSALLDRVPGWLLLLAVAIVLAVVLALTSWQR